MADIKPLSFGAAQVGASPLTELTNRPDGSAKYSKAHGDRLKSPVAQKDWTVSNDGNGLLTARIVYGMDHSVVDSTFQIGMTFPKLPRLFLHKAESTFGSSGMAKVSTEWVGITEGQDRTTIHTETSGNVSSEPIETHPNFKSTLAGTEFKPKNGALFEKGNFKAFGKYGAEDVTKPNRWMIGIKSYYEPSVSIRGSFFTTKISGAGSDLELGQLIAHVSYDGKFGGIQLVPPREVSAYSGDQDKGTQDKNYMLTSVSFEEYAAGKIYKVTYEVQLSGDRGWNARLYFFETNNIRPLIADGG